MKVLVSILNWNKAEQTLNCIRSLSAERNSADLTILVIDNGSKQSDISFLSEKQEIEGFVLKLLPKNLGFTGGHNVAIDIALKEGYDFVWLVNNDSVIVPGALNHLLKTMEAHESCGAVSPVVRDIQVPHPATSCVNVHHWNTRSCVRYNSIPQAQQVQDERPKDVWLLGTGILFRVDAIREVGSLNDDLFAYYDDDDIGSRLAAAGWTSRCVFEASILHETRRTDEQYPLYYYYLIKRNEMLFWHKHMPRPHRRFLWLKVVDTGLFDVNRLYKKGLHAQADMALLGVSDFIFRKFGPPILERTVPLFIRLMCHIHAKLNQRKLVKFTSAVT